MGRVRRVRWTMTVAAALATMLGGLTTPNSAEAQRPRFERGPAAYLGLSFVTADPRGEMGQLVDRGFGGQIDGRLPLDRAGHVRLRGDLGFVVYGHERVRSCWSLPVGCRIETDLTTTNSIFYGGLGPELVLTSGAVEPYLYATFGYAWFATRSSLGGADEWDDFASTTNYSDGAFAWRGGGGIRVRVSDGRTPVSLDLGLERHDNGIVDYLTEGDIQDHPDGSVTLFPNRTEAELLTLRVGVSIALPRGDDRDDRRRRRGRR